MKVKPFNPLGQKVKTKKLKPRNKVEKVDKYIKESFKAKN
jgi:hypothetical protein